MFFSETGTFRGRFLFVPVTSCSVSEFEYFEGWNGWRAAEGKIRSLCPESRHNEAGSPTLGSCRAHWNLAGLRGFRVTSSLHGGWRADGAGMPRDGGV
jgi:hypothetical protein